MKGGFLCLHPRSQFFDPIKDELVVREERPKLLKWNRKTTICGNRICWISPVRKRIERSRCRGVRGKVA
jgi:hypothetical protein